MDGWLKGLIAGACLAVLGAAGWWAWSIYQDRAAALAAAEQEARLDRIMQSAEQQQREVECQGEIAAWDAGDRAALERMYGEAAGQIVDNCRYLVSIPSE